MQLSVSPPLEKGGIEGSIILVHYSRIRPFKNQPRTRFNKQRLEELAASIKATRQKKPIDVKPVTDDPSVDYEIIDGERRWQACQIAEVEMIRCIIENPANEMEQYLDSVTSNMGPEPHTDIEMLNAVRKMRFEYKLDAKVIAVRCCRSIAWVDQRVQIIKQVHPDVVALMDEDTKRKKRLTFNEVFLMRQLSHEDQKGLADEITLKGIRWSQARPMIEKRMASHGIGVKAAANEPRHRHAKLVNLLDHSNRELDLLLERDVAFFEEIFRNRQPSDRKSAIEKLRKIMESAEAMKITLENLNLKHPDS